MEKNLVAASNKALIWSLFKIRDVDLSVPSHSAVL